MTTQSAVLQLVFEIDSAGASNTTYVTDTRRTTTSR